jgi:hypothetical protein
VDLDTFLAMPPGTVFAKYQPQFFDVLMVKHESSEHSRDFYYASLTDEVDSSGSCETYALLEAAQEKGVSINLHFNTECRDGMREPGQLFAVWERADVEGLVSRLQRALVDGYGVPKGGDGVELLGREHD